MVVAIYDRTLKSLDEHIIPHRNVVFERFKFRGRIQPPGKSVDSFINALHPLVEHCEYGQLKDELIRDTIMVGILNQNLSERL